MDHRVIGYVRDTRYVHVKVMPCNRYYTMLVFHLCFYYCTVANVSLL